MDNEMTRTELGYALWKEDPKTVAAARVQAAGIIGKRKIIALIEEPAVKLLDWIARAPRER